MFDRPVVDSSAFAREAGQLKGQVAIQDLDRLRDQVIEQAGRLDFELSGFVNARGKQALRLRVRGDLMLACQRCLGPLAFRLDSTREFELVPPEQALDDLAEEADEIEQMHAQPKLDVLSMVEDEAILSLPMAATHDAGSCEPLATGAQGAAESPFSKLSALKRQ